MNDVVNGSEEYEEETCGNCDRALVPDPNCPDQLHAHDWVCPVCKYCDKCHDFLGEEAEQPGQTTCFQCYSDNQDEV